MFLKLQTFLVSLVFFSGLELIAIERDFVFQIAVFILIFSVYQGRKIGGNWKFSVLPGLFSISSVTLLYLIGLIYEQQIFILLSSAMYYLALLGAYRLRECEGDKTAKGMIMAASASTIFFTYTGFYGIYLNFLVPLYVLMLAYLLVTLLVSYQYFSLTKEKNRSKIWIYSFLLSLAMAEIIWTLNFWPFGYLTTGAVALILYYVLLDTVFIYFSGILSRKRVVSTAALLSVLVAIILLSSKWVPVI